MVFRVTDLNNRIDASLSQMLTNGRKFGRTDGRANGRTNGKPDPYIAPCLRQARQISGFCKCLVKLTCLISVM